MHSFDIVFLVIFIILGTLGLKKGFLNEVFQLAAIAGGLIGAYLTYEYVFEILPFEELSGATLTVTSFIIAYVFWGIAIFFTGWSLKKLIHLTILGWIDRILGVAFGTIKALFSAWIFVIVISALPSETLHDAFMDSVIFNALKEIPLSLSIPETSDLMKSYDKIKDSLPIKEINDTKNSIDSLQSKLKGFGLDSVENK